MTGRLQLIEQKLIAIDPAGFQNLCDTYLMMREEGVRSFNRTGSQLGKQKTKIGTPDSFVRLHDNKLACIEYTTQAESKVLKIKADIEKCLDEEKTGVPAEKLDQIVICFNSRLTMEEEVEIQGYAQQLGKRIDLIGIDTLAIEIQSKYLLLSRDFLGIPIETGQILPFDKFISEYNNKAHQLSTPLDNEFLHREKELQELLGSLESTDLLIVSGAPGIGKTKIGVKVIQEFIELNPSYVSFAIAKKGVDILDDLKIQLKVDRDYILLIDDANRQLSNFTQILGVFKEGRKGRIKILVTVRNYALDDVKNLTFDLEKEVIDLKKFSDEEIIQIISSDSFKIHNHEYQKRIVVLSDGNARLAVMASRLANMKHEEFLIGDVSDLFDSYFGTFMSDFDLFNDRKVLKVLGIISFFFSINRNDKSLLESIFQLFEIGYYDFNEAIEELHKRELIEVQFNRVRISEQVMATYFFYKVFIKDQILSFNILINNFFPAMKSRFKDSIIPANNSFGYENVFTKIHQDLNIYLQRKSEDEDAALDFLDLFWFYLPEDTLAYFHTKISELPEPDSLDYMTKYEINDFVFEKERTLDFISRFFNHITSCFDTAVLLGFEFIRKKPEHLPEFIRRIKETLIFSHQDERLGFKRQVDFIKILIEKANNGNAHYLAAFFDLSKFFLKQSFHVTEGGRNHSISWYEYPLPFYRVTEDLRASIWRKLFLSFDEFPHEVYEVIKDFRPSYHELEPEVMDFDLGLLVPFVSENFSPMIFKYAHCVQEMIYRFDREDRITNRSYRELKQKFLTEDYLSYRKLDWDKFRDKEEFEFDNWEEYGALKSEELKSYFLFGDESEFPKLFTAIENIQCVKVRDYFPAGQSVDIIIEENFKKNNELGFLLFQKILGEFPKGLQFPHRGISAIARCSPSWCLKIWSELEQWENENSLYWKICFFRLLPTDFIDKFYCDRLLDLIESIDRYTYLYVEDFSRFNLIDKDFSKTVLSKISKKNDDLGLVIAFEDDVFEKNLDLFDADYVLISKSYFQQFRINHSQIFDFKGKGIEAIFQSYPGFLMDFVHQLEEIERNGRGGKDISFGFVWKYEGVDEIITEVSDFLVENDRYLGYRYHAHSILFKELDQESSKKGYSFVQKEIEKHCKDSKKIQVYFQTIRSCFKENFDVAFLDFLAINSDLELFKSIDWIGNAGVMWGDVSFGEINAKRWANILELVNKFDDKLAMIPIKNFLKKRIESEYKFAEYERERKFSTPDW
ncbi:hypothetical protein SAMN04489724_1758 [Algoriphagus locisalis]|uniref:Uncharacterized protein n=1 Tax=Algoriphagus locisalis TaxID=305507 RepID=A0A1I7A8F9_9BACT|nr:hypothetical protein [Algoriphagus locisalis]SFT71233.1 hypothetical protein SAMN04489724_1758 [Algoriphagus locisalis]